LLSSGIVEAYSFLSETQTLWSAAAAGEKRLAGSHTWNFAFAVPPEVKIKGKYDRAARAARAPGTFVEQHGGQLFIQYDLVCHIRRPVLKVDSKCVQPSPPPLACSI
jgi:hypothetical protein